MERTHATTSTNRGEQKNNLYRHHGLLDFNNLSFSRACFVLEQFCAADCLNCSKVSTQIETATSKHVLFMDIQVFSGHLTLVLPATINI